MSDNLVEIHSAFTVGAKLPAVSQDDIKREPMLHRADWSFARDHGGPLTNDFLDVIQFEGWAKSPVVIDSRVHMLMPGMYPCVPGWHHDDVPRERSDGQPEYLNPSYESEHAMALWGDASLTEFATGYSVHRIPPIGEKVYKVWHEEVENLCDSKVLHRFTAPERRVIYFNWQTWHRGMSATKRGFRFFIRITRHTKLEARNEIRMNANVYMPVLEEGW